MTKAEKSVLDAIKALTKDGVPPSYREIMLHTGKKSLSGVHRCVHSLIRHGHLAGSYPSGGYVGARKLKLADPYEGKTKDELLSLRRILNRRIRDFDNASVSR